MALRLNEDAQCENYNHSEIFTFISDWRGHVKLTDIFVLK